MKKILFLFRSEFESQWRDGLYKALELLGNDYAITYWNMYDNDVQRLSVSEYDFLLGWGAFGSDVDLFLQTKPNKKGLCIAGNARSPVGCENYDVLFYETHWYEDTIGHHKNIVHAFGTNTELFRSRGLNVFWDYLTVGAFAEWKRQRYLKLKTGKRLAVGEIQKDNLNESMRIVANLLSGGIAVLPQVTPEVLCDLYNMSKTLYIPADINGGGERAILEARACGIDVEVEDDNPKLRELVDSRLYDHLYYYEQLKKGIGGVL